MKTNSHQDMINEESNLLNNYHQEYGESKNNSSEAKKPIYKKWWFYLIIVFVVISIAGIAGGGDTGTPANNDTQQEEPSENTDKEEPVAEPEPIPEPEPVFNPTDYQNGITYDNLARTPDDYLNSKVAFNGEVVQLIEGDGETQCRLAVEGNYDNMLFIGYDPSIIESRVLEGDYIMIYGYSVGIISYESTMGGTVSIPGVRVEKILY